MSFPAGAIWEARSSGNSDRNGAAYVSGLGGTDYSQQDTPQLTLTDVVTTGGSAVITSVTGGFTSQMVGNGLSLDEGGSIRWYYVTAYTSTNQVTLDKNVIGGSLTGVALRLGGAANIANNSVLFAAFIAAGNVVYERGSFSHNTNSPVYSASGSATNPIIVEGYTSARGDGGFSTHNTTTVDAFHVTGNFYVIRNIKGDVGNSTGRAIKAEGWSCTFENCLGVSNLAATGTGASRWYCMGSNNRFYRCRADGSSNAGYGFHIVGTGNTFDHCESYAGTELSGFHQAAAAYGARFLNCISRDNTGAASDGITLLDQIALIQQCNLSKNGRDGVRMVSPGGSLSDIAIVGCIFNRNGQTSGYEINYSSADISTNPGAIAAALTNIKSNAFYVTGAGKSNNLPPFSGDVTLSGDPFVDSGSGHDFTLNNTAGAGATVRATPWTVSMPGGVGTDYHDLGALGSQSGITPTAPSSLAATVVSSTQVNLTWTDNSSDEVYFFVERADNGGSFAVIATLAAGTTSYSDTDVLPNNRYQYRVRVVN